jgi:hypothetical protein
MEAAWYEYCSKWDNQTPSRAISQFHANLFHDVVRCLSVVVIDTIRTQSKDRKQYAQLRKFHMIRFFHSLKPRNLEDLAILLVCFEFFVDNLDCNPSLQWTNMVGTHGTELVQNVQLKCLKLEHLNLAELCPVRVHFGSKHSFTSEEWILHRVRVFS